MHWHMYTSFKTGQGDFMFLRQGEALYAMELALSLEKLNFTKLRELWKIANEAEDGQLTDFIGIGPCASQKAFHNHSSWK